jgi:DNA topoisomerase-1
MLIDHSGETPLPLAEGIRPVPADEQPDTGTALCPPLPADLHYVDDSGPGISRRVLRGKFAYFSPTGERIRDAAEISRINKLAIPPAYTDVWICPDPMGHMQATGRDARGRKQYRYHVRWREIRDSNKYERILSFGASLPKLRARLEQNLALRGMPREKVMALVVQLLESTLIRVGNSRYARENRSYGLTTLRTRHVHVQGAAIRFQFRGKSGVEHQVTLKNQRLARIMRRCMELPGQHLFQYLDEDGQRHAVSSSDVNQFLQEVTGGDFTAKDYRTWAGSALALEYLRKRESQPEAVARRNVVEIVKDVSRQLGNTPTVCRQCYIHPDVLDAFASGELAQLPRARKRKWMTGEEVALLNFLTERNLRTSTSGTA